MPRPTPVKVRQANRRIGEHITTWRKLQSLTAQQVAERAGISRGTLHRVENGSGAVSLETFLNITRALGILDRVLDAVDPYETDLGRIRADQTLPQRVRSS